MRRLAMLACCAAAATAAAPAVARAAAAEQQLPALQARLASCTTGDAARARTAAFTASMPAIDGTASMWIRFDLFQRMTGEAEFAPVQLPAWGRWERSEPGRTGFIYTKKVQALRAPGAYRARVRFRWYGTDGRVLRRAQRLTKTCRQLDPRPDLRAGALTVAGGLGPATATYLLTVTNSGRGAAGPFDVRLTAEGMPAAPVRSAGLAAGESSVVSIPGPRCAAGATVRFLLDAGAAVDESDEADDVVDRLCPAAG
jgi:CARDB protein